MSDQSQGEFTLCAQVRHIHDWTPAQKNSMRRLFEQCLREWPSLVHCMRDTQGTLVYQAIERGGYDWYSLAQFDLKLVQLTDEHRMDEAIAELAERLDRAINEFWPDCSIPSYAEFLKERSRRRESQTTSATRPAQ